jgi:hypothetical protein
LHVIERPKDIEQIRRAWVAAEPARHSRRIAAENPAWFNAMKDTGLLLAYIETLEAHLAAVTK